jgi:hypothetical protein
MEEPWSPDPSVVEEVVAVRERFVDSLGRIEAFLRDAEKGLQNAGKMWSEIHRKLAAAERGEVLGPENSNEVAVELDWDEFNALKESADEALNIADHYPGMLAEMALISLFATYDAFVSDLLTTAFRARPQILRSGKQITAKSVLDASSLEDLVEVVISREIEDWRLSFREQIARMDERFSLSVSKNERDVATVAEAHERRHLFVHRGGIVDMRYLNAVPEAGIAKGAQMSVDLAYWERVARAMARLVVEIAIELPVRCLRIDRAALVTDYSDADG